MFHRHRWSTTGAHFNPPPSFGTAEARDSRMLLMAIQGFTNVTQTCTGCGLVSTQQRPGRVNVEVAGDVVEEVRR
jgi:hypothetical protein